MSASVCTMDGVEVGNTKTSTRIAVSKYWSFTLNNHTLREFEILKNEICLHCLDYRVQEEIGDTGTPHLQGYIQAKKPIRPCETFSNKRIHWEKARSPRHAREYCTKNDSATGQFVLDTRKELKLIVPNRPWQKEILNILTSDADDRVIHWYYDYEGNTGKSCFTKYLCAKLGAITLSGKSDNCKYMVCEYFKQKNNWPEICIFDIPRTNLDYINYDAIESIKNGCFFSGKYECAQALMNSPHIICFANSKPEMHKLSTDRWRIIQIKPEEIDLSKYLDDLVMNQ